MVTTTLHMLFSIFFSARATVDPETMTIHVVNADDPGKRATKKSKKTFTVCAPFANGKAFAASSMFMSIIRMSLVLDASPFAAAIIRGVHSFKNG